MSSLGSSSDSDASSLTTLAAPTAAAVTSPPSLQEQIQAAVQEALEKVLPSTALNPGEFSLLFFSVIWSVH